MFVNTQYANGVCIGRARFRENRGFGCGAAGLKPSACDHCPQCRDSRMEVEEVMDGKEGESRHLARAEKVRDIASRIAGAGAAAAAGVERPAVAEKFRVREV